MHQYSTILVGSDFTPCSAVALRQAMRIAAWPAEISHGPSRLRVVHVIDTLVAVEIEEALSPLQRGIIEGRVEDAKVAWKTFSADIEGAADLPIDVLVDNRVAGIVRTACRAGADLLVLGAFGHGEPDVGVGTVATACVRTAMCDVLLVRDTRPRKGASPFRRVVVAVDFSPTSLRAVERAALVASHDGAELHVLHVFQAPWHRMHYRAPTPEATPSFQRQFSDALHGRLVEFCRPALAVAANAKAVHVVLEHGEHRSGIVEHAAKVGADLIVLGTRGRTNLRDILLGTTAEKALRESTCSVLAVKPEGFKHPLAEPATVPHP